MEKNYYEILEIDKNASNEIIEKAYKTLAKKYHPDLQEEGKKASAEEHMKKINEAYAVLSDETMRIEYDESLENENITKEEYSKILQENSYLKAKIEQLNRNINNASNNVENTYNTNEYQGNHQHKNQYYQQPRNQYHQNQYYQQPNNSQGNAPENLAEYYINKMNQSIQQAYQDAYIQDMKNRGYRFKTKHTIKDYLKMIATIAITIIIAMLIFQIPFVKKYFISVYQDNYFVKIIVDMFVNTFKQMFKM